MQLRPETQCAIRAARAAGALCARRVDVERVVHKGELDIATGTDLLAEDSVRSELSRNFSYPIVGEERGGAPPRDGAPYWLIDPLCGTETYACRLPTFCTNIALVEDGHVTIGVVFDSANGEVYFAERGKGAHIAKESLTQPLHARLGTTLALELAQMPTHAGSFQPFGALFSCLLESRRFHVRSLGSTLSLARVATGDFAGALLVGRIPSPLHTAAGCLLAEEAGASVQDERGAAWQLTSTSLIIAATPELCQELVGWYGSAFG